MKAVIRSVYGSPDVLSLSEVDRPNPKDEQVLIKLRAAGVNPLDWHILRGAPFLVRLMGYGLRKPKHQILGADMAGSVEAVGKSVTRFKVGDEVYGSGMGGFAEYACCREDKLVPKPDGISFEQAAAVPIAAVTALQALRDQGKLESGQRVLINGASGGVGSFAVQIAKVMGAQVTGVCSGPNMELVKSLGANDVIDYTKEQFWQRKDEFDLVVDNAAFHSIGKALGALKPGGKYVLVGGSSSTGSLLLSLILNPLFSIIKGRKIVSFIADINLNDLAELNGYLESGKIVSVIDKTYSLDETAQAIGYVEEGHTRGKVVVKI